MKVIVTETGEPGTVTTLGRMNARAGSKVLADILAEETFADVCNINLDWVGDGITPAMIINTSKWYPQYGGKRLDHHWPLDIEEVFGLDHADHDLFREIVKALREEFDRDRPAPVVPSGVN